MSWIRSLQAYWGEVKRVRALAPGALRTGSLVRDFAAWRRTQRKFKDPLEMRRPWLSFAATRFLERQLKPAGRVFEWGSGNSTIFFAERVAEVVSVEYDSAWVQLVQ